MAFGLDIRFSFYCVERYTCCDFLVLSLSFIFRNTKNINYLVAIWGRKFLLADMKNFLKAQRRKRGILNSILEQKLPCEQACIVGRSCSFCNPKICLLNTSKSKLTSRLCPIQLAQYRKKNLS